MARPTTNDLVRLLSDPSETLTVEHKGWLDLTQNPHRAILAKAAIALANEGGGIIVLGTREDITQGGKLGSYPPPSGLPRYSQDEINSVIERFADPRFHCDLVFASHPDTKVEHAFVIVPGGMTVPVMSRRGSDGEIQAQRCYVRKPGPKSEEPYTAEEWRGVFERCLQARRVTMLDAIRVIIRGQTEAGPVPPTVRARLRDFVSASQAHWESLIEPVPVDDPARMTYGRYEIAFSITGIEQTLSLGELKKRMEEASRVKLTGWSPFVIFYRQPIQPYPIDGMIEAWIGDPSDDQMGVRDTATADFWRAHPAGDFLLLRGYDEDSDRRVTPGTVTDINLPIWRVGETLLYASRLAKLFGDNPEVHILCQYFGLKNRSLVNLSGPFGFQGKRLCMDNVVTLEGQATAQQLEDNLVEVLHPLLRPLYERFSFFELEPKLVSLQVELLRKGRF